MDTGPKLTEAPCTGTLAPVLMDTGPPLTNALVTDVNLVLGNEGRGRGRGCGAGTPGLKPSASVRSASAGTPGLKPNAAAVDISLCWDAAAR